MIINPETFLPTGPSVCGAGEDGTVEVTIRRETRRVDATRVGDRIIARGLLGRYQQGAKAWPAVVVSRVIADGSRHEFANFGRDDRSGRFRKENCLWFA